MGIGSSPPYKPSRVISARPDTACRSLSPWRPTSAPKPPQPPARPRSPLVSHRTVDPPTIARPAIPESPSTAVRNRDPWMGSKCILQSYGTALAGIALRGSTRVRARPPRLRPSTIRNVSGTAVSNRDFRPSAICKRLRDRWCAIATRPNEILYQKIYKKPKAIWTRSSSQRLGGTRKSNGVPLGRTMSVVGGTRK
jgi:hypothetical protein